ncbi:LysR family transcriptional regulator [Pseudoteredinibacter isoporae]|uniref:LysR family transcriptional regulator n=1 Tax=Pseudoteredinibacter isoporae TaxID=570281 RepID=UPI00310BCADE
MNKLERMKVFVEAAGCESFVEASRRLNLSAPAVTRAVAALEQSLGGRLFNRTTRQVRLTEVGRRFYEDSRRILDQLEEAESAASGSYSSPKGALTITAPVLFGQKYVVPVLADYLSCFPEVSIRAMFYDRVSNMLDEGLDVAIRIGHLEDSAMYAVHVGNVRRVVCGSPEYFAEKGVPKCPAELSDHQIIMASGVEASTRWSFESPEGKESVNVLPRLYCNQNGAAIEAAKNGAGITRLMSYQVGKELEEGALHRILSEYETEPLPINIVYLERRTANAKIRSFVDFAAERLRKNPFIR